MAKLLCQKDFVVISSGETVNVYHGDTKFSLNIPRGFNACMRKSDSKIATNSQHILCMNFSQDGSYFGACDETKTIAIWNTAISPWSLLNCRSFTRKCISIHFTKHEKVLIADKSGDVYECDIKNLSLEPVLLMGHISMLLDLTMSEDEKYIVTCDRDEKIRISCYPNAYNIKSFCMGHTEYVINVFFLPKKPELIVSGSGDGTVRFWKFKTGEEISRISCADVMSESLSDNSIQGTSSTCKFPMKGLRFSNKLDILAVLFANPKICLYKIDTDGPELVTWSHIQTLDLACEPWDARFNDDGLLLVVLPCEDLVLEVFCYSTAEKSLQRVEVMKTSEFSPVKTIRNDWNFLKASLDVSTDYHLLFKQWYDNVKEYYNKKEERNMKKLKNS